MTKPSVDTGNLSVVAQGVWVIGDRRVPLVPNIGVVCGRDAVLVVDTGMGPENGAKVLAAARKLAGVRKLLLTITHFHPEHGYGAQAFKGVATIIYNRSQADELVQKGAGYLDMFSGMNAEVATALEGTELVAADQFYDGTSHTIDLGGRTVILQQWGKAHTKGDQTIFVEDARVLFTGDLAEEKTFPIFPWFPPHDTDIDSDRWVAALQDCESLAPRVVVPGHGNVGGVEILSEVRSYITELTAMVGAARGNGVEAMIAELKPKMLARHPDWHFPEWIDFAIRYLNDTH